MKLTHAPAIPGDSTYEHGLVRLEVLEVLRGDSVPAVLHVRGILTTSDNFATDSVPYRYGTGGGPGCYNTSYRLGAEHLLLLVRNHRGELQPDWPYAPTNEQLRGPSDPWLLWVREAVSRSK